MGEEKPAAATVANQVAAEIPLTPSEQRALMKRLDDVEKRAAITADDVVKIVKGILDERAAAAVDSKKETERRERTGLGNREVKR